MLTNTEHKDTPMCRECKTRHSDFVLNIAMGEIAIDLCDPCAIEIAYQLLGDIVQDTDWDNKASNTLKLTD